MKKLFGFLLLMVTCLATQAQTVNPLKLPTASYKLFDYGFSATMTTTDSAVNTIQTIEVGEDEAGVIEVQCVAFNDSLGLAVTGSKILRYVKTGGTLTLGSATNVLTSVTDAGLGTATWAVSAADDNIILTVKGKLNYTVNWRVVTRRIYQQ